jgi:hypothetical protein
MLGLTWEGTHTCCVVTVYRSRTGKILRIEKERPELALFSSFPKHRVQPASERAY